MKKILIIGCPGSGKSTLAKELSGITNYPIMHLDKVYHINNDEHINRDELKDKISEFNKDNSSWIIDGNYLSTLEFRLKLADTVILFDISTDRCIENVKTRAIRYKDNNRSDMASGFVEGVDEDFLDYIKHFRNNMFPEIIDILSDYNKNVYIIKNYQEKQWFLENFL